MIIFFNNHNNRCTSGEEEVKRVCKSTRRRKKSVKSSTFIRHFIIPTYQAYSINSINTAKGRFSPRVRTEGDSNKIVR